MRLEVAQQQIVTLSQQHADLQHRLAAHVAAAQPLHSAVQKLTSNMSFIAHVQKYDALMRQATELSDRCRELMTGHDQAADGHGPPASSEQRSKQADHALSASSLDAHDVHSVCAAFLELLRIFQGLQDATHSRDVSEEKDQIEHKYPDESKAAPAAVVLNLQRMVQQRILTIWRPLHGRLIELYEQTLVALQWPQTSTTLLMGLHTLPALPAATSGTTSPGAALLLSPSSISASALSSSLALFALLTENLIRIQRLLEECGMSDEVRRIEREIDVMKQSASMEKYEGKRGRARPPSRLWVLSLLLKPIYRRFYFHFDTPSSAVVVSDGSDAASANPPPGTSLTNRLDKPEWVCTYLEKIYRDHADFLRERVQPIVNVCWMPSHRNQGGNGRFYEFHLEFLEALLSMYHSKLLRPSTQQALSINPPILRHTLGELISFEGKIGTEFDYPIFSSRRLSLMDAFLRSRPGVELLIKSERESVNKGLDALRNLPKPWGMVLARHQSVGVDGAESSDEEDASLDDGVDLMPSPDVESADLLGSASPLSTDLSSNPSAKNATHSSLHFLTLLSSLSSRMRSLKFLNVRYTLMRELMFKLFEIYEEDLLRAYQENWTRLTENVRKGGVQYLMLQSKRHARNQSSASLKSPQARLNPLSMWQNHMGILNSLSYILSVLRGWGDEELFLELYFYYQNRQRIQQSFQQDLALGGELGGVLPYGATPGGEEEVLITSEELALWMVQAGSSSLGAPAAAASAEASTAAAAAQPTSSAVSKTASFLPAEFQQTVEQLHVLQTLWKDNAPGNAKSEAAASYGSARPSSAAVPSSAASNAPATLPLDLSLTGTLFDPILASYSSLRDELLTVLVGVVVAHFRENVEQKGYAARGFMDPSHAQGAAGAAQANVLRHPELVTFLMQAQQLSASRNVSPASVADYSLLEHHVELSREFATPLLDLKMQLLVVAHGLVPTLHRAFWTSVSAKLNKFIYEVLVEGKYFSQRGALGFIRDMRALFGLFALYQQPSFGVNAGMQPHFKLLQDVINVLLLSPAQRDSLRVALTEGSVASSSASTMRAYLSKPPFAIQKLSASQVLDLLAHIREEATQEASPEEEVVEASPDEDESKYDEHEQELVEDDDAAAEEEDADEEEDGPVDEAAAEEQFEDGDQPFESEEQQPEYGAEEDAQDANEDDSVAQDEWDAEQEAAAADAALQRLAAMSAAAAEAFSHNAISDTALSPVTETSETAHSTEGEVAQEAAAPEMDDFGGFPEEKDDEGVEP